MIYIVVVAVLVLLVASPGLQKILIYPQTEVFTEVWILGPEHNAENYPVNVTSGISYRIFLGLSNHLGTFSYYQVQVKLRNQDQSGADSFNGTSSSLQSLYNVYAFLSDNETFELPVSFSINYMVDLNGSRANLDSMVLNNKTLNLSGYSVSSDVYQRYLINLFFEIWIYDDALVAFKYHQRFVSLTLNLQE